MMVTGMNPWYGLAAPAGTKVAAEFGARAILGNINHHHKRTEQYIEILPDRKTIRLPDGTETMPKKFERWLQKKFLPWLKKNCGQEWIDRGGAEVFALDDGIFHARACANNSHGYLYLGAWMDAET